LIDTAAGSTAASNLTHEARTWLIVLVSVGAVIAMCFVNPIPQDPGYHLFADTRRIAGIANFWNVVSNLPFLAVGIVGLLRYPRLAHRESAEGYVILCAGVVLVCFGSGYYHESPSNERLFWDRLPMTIAFMALFYLLLSERVFRSTHRYALWLLVAVGIGAALYWSWTESLGRGDLRPYALVQFLPIVLTPLILCLFKPRYLSNSLLLAAMGFYVLAKLLEQFDGEVFAATSMSGHALKHVAAAGAVLCIIYGVPARESTTPRLT
jgi:hypothetical protein